ncbi:hypothetical protein FIU87_15485 [Bacillus sp. THAF10]|uniref:type II secretion system protein n=1 Tax=Bacillus sp. THAF10 TaxID=2587848 RepID=UPI001268A180|nr:prepilin-type N-terminal cleavage/methylation domain-containing protein [Bacillus sp. THAF10]QFT90066.1 hypothetical protein FIU87_15485 [Bacillus sp. THAF10]
MRRLGEWRNEDGVTLLELLAVIVISGIILSTIYGVFITGINLYKKIGIESQLKEEADYIVANVLNEFYAFSPDDVVFDDNQDELSLFKKTELQLNNKDFIASSEKESAEIEKVMLQLVDNQTGKDLFLTTTSLIGEEREETTTQVNNDKYHIKAVKDQAGEDLPIFDFQCTTMEKSMCKGGIITFQFSLSHEIYSQETNRLYVEPIEFYSKFGY